MARKNGKTEDQYVGLVLGNELTWILLVISFLGAVVVGMLWLKNRAQLQVCSVKEASYQGRIADLQATLARIAPQLVKGGKRYDQPPKITLKEADGFRFQSGSSVVPEYFKQQLTTKIVPQILEIQRKYAVNTVYVIGHTDEAPLQSRSHSNLDTALLSFLWGNADHDLAPVDNTGLGMARAASIAQMLQTRITTSNMNILPLSGGQVILPNGSLSFGETGGNADRRRIEIIITNQVR